MLQTFFHVNDPKPLPYLYKIAVFIMDRHGDFYILGSLLLPFVKLSMDQSDIDVISNITWNNADDDTLSKWDSWDAAQKQR